MNHADFKKPRLDRLDGLTDQDMKRDPQTELQEPFYSPKEVALALGVSESSVKRWCDAGKIPNSKTNGGHRRMTTTGLIEFLRKQKREVEFPALIGLPSVKLPGEKQAINRLMMETAVAERVSGCRDIILQLYLEQWELHRIFDEAIMPAADIYRRNGLDHQDLKEFSYDHHCLATETCEEAIKQVWRFLPHPQPGNLMTVGINLGDRPDSILSLGTRMILWEMGCSTPNNNPERSLDSFQRTVLELNPGIVWACLPKLPKDESELTRIRDVMNRIARNLTAGVPILISGVPLPASFTNGLESVSVTYSLSRLVGAIRKQFVL